jgi:hypothetical protein
MAGIELSSFLKLAPTNPSFILEDKYIRGGVRMVADTAARDQLATTSPAHLKAGMLVVTQDDLKIWQLGTDLTTWTEFVGGGTGGSGTIPIASDTVLGGIKIGDGLTINPTTGVLTSLSTRQVFTYTTATIPANGTEQFTAALGKTSTILNLSIDQGYAQLQGFSTSARNDTNPYTFVAVPTHLTDDGSTTLLDGTVIQGRRYTILSNLENPPTENIYWTITNNGTVPQSYQIQIVYITTE